MSKLDWGTKPCVVFLLWAASAIASPAQTFKTLHNFKNTDGADPVAGLVQAADGDLFGTTQAGGVTGDGTVFKVTASGAFEMIYSFCSLGECADGALPADGLVQDANGDFYGTTSQGGINFDFGTVFKITSGGALTTLHNFCVQARCPDGGVPFGALALGANGNFFGTTSQGVAGSASGTVFEITPSGRLSTLHTFNGADGQQSVAGMALARDGSFYGTTFYGGASEDGTIFKITPTGTLTSLHSFCRLANCSDGSNPEAALIQGSDGSLYGTTANGGASAHGTVFKITPGGALTTLHSFCSLSLCADGEFPRASLVQATDGMLYGTTSEGGANGDGTVFSITPSGKLTTLHSFIGTDGAGPDGGLVQDTNGTLYGTTASGGAHNDGTIFSLSVGLGLFVKTQPAIGKVGESVTILGTNLTGATSVTFNGTAAAFAVKSSSEITTTVPTGSTTGTVQVVTPSGGTLSSNVPFTVN
jgi:uncharacterized repeat protein (TIGR03803 family)